MNSIKSCFIYGGGGHAKVVLDVITAQFGFEYIAGIFDDDLTKMNTKFYGTNILGPVDSYKEEIFNLIIAIGDNQTRKEKAIKYDKKVNNFLTAIDPSVSLAGSAKINAGTVVMPGVVLNADAYVGRHCIINTNTTIEHDCIVEDFAHIAPGSVLTGGVKIGQLTLVGANSTVTPGIKIGCNCLICAGSVVTTNIPDNAIVRGNPARVVKINF